MIFSTAYFLTGNYFQMNSGFSTVIDAIFGKKDLDSVSLEEMYEVVQEFPSFNAAHLLLSKKLIQNNNASFEKESMRTSLYFNNPLWLQFILEESVQAVNGEVAKGGPDLPYIHEESKFVELVRIDAEKVEEPDVPITEVIPERPLVQSVDFFNSEQKPESENTNPEFHDSEKEAGTVTNFDELMSKYKIEVPEPVLENPENPPVEKTEIVHEVRERATESFVVETAEGVLNEYGIFEDADLKPGDQDLIAFDRPHENSPAQEETMVSGIKREEPHINELENIVENQYSGRSPEKSDEADYASFDKPVEFATVEAQPTDAAMLPDKTYNSPEEEANDTNGTDLNSAETENEMKGQVQELVSQFGEKHRSLPVFDAKKAESIVFAPYHMIDYFASQGIKLVLEDQPADNFGKQLKSFTDWLKVMKKLPLQPVSEKQNDKEADRIRHFAEHSIEERDILTESMAEVLAKQGMYENAIALYQKLSLIYPPKSAYFASRIEQLKASLS
jgi:hypothetical protein